jgi:hypothetical protein
MKLHASLKLNGRTYQAGEDVAWYSVYPFFLVHMLLFGGSGFLMAYAQDGPPAAFLYAHGGIAIFVYTVFYLAIFGLDEVKWMFINAGLGLLAIYTQVDWLLSLFGKDLRAYPLHINVIPFLYYVLYTFLLRQALLDLAGAREDEERRRTVDNLYVGGSVALSLAAFFL